MLIQSKESLSTNRMRINRLAPQRRNRNDLNDIIHDNNNEKRLTTASSNTINSSSQKCYFVSAHRRTLLTIIIIAMYLIPAINAVLNEKNLKISWMVGHWRSEFSGKIIWPTVPTLTYGEELFIGEALTAKTTKAQFMNFSARAWSHSTRDRFHDEWGFLTVDGNGNATLMTTGNNGFITYEVGTVSPDKIVLTLKDIGRVSFSRDLPVEDLRRTFIRHGNDYMEQILEMRTATHPKNGYLEHTRIMYERQSNKI